jgi:hypothetical protein
VEVVEDPKVDDQVVGDQVVDVQVVDDQVVDNLVVEGLQVALEDDQAVDDLLAVLAVREEDHQMGDQKEGHQMAEDPLVDLEAHQGVDSPVVIVVHKAHEVQEASKVHEVLRAGEVPDTVALSTVEAQEDRQAGMEEDGLTVTVLGGHPDGQAPDIILVMAPISHQAGYQAGSPYPITWEFQSRFRFQMGLGAVLLTDQTCTSATTATTVQVSFMIQAATISAVTMIRAMSGTTIRVVSTTTITPKAVTTWTANTMKMASGSTTTLAPSMTTKRIMRKTTAKKDKQTVSMLSQPSKTVESIKRRLQTLRWSCQIQLWQTRLL